MNYRIALFIMNLTATGALIGTPAPATANAIDTATPTVHRFSNAFLQAQIRQAAIPNLATGSRIQASSLWSAVHAADKVIDADPASRWAATSAKGQWLQLDLGQPQAIAGVVLNEFQSRITHWHIETSTDGQQWHTVYTATKHAGADDTHTRFDLPQTVAARHVKLVIDAAVDAPSLYELKLLAPASSKTMPLNTGAQASTSAATLDAHDAKFSPATLQFLKTNTGLNGEQWDNIMQVVNKPEQDSLDWPKFYGYCENIGDNRGYTIGIFGATTGGSNDTGPDGPALFKAFDAASGSSNPSIAGGLTRAGVHGKMSGSILKITDSASVFCGKIKTLQNNANWRAAMWQTFYNVYIKYSVQQARNRGFNSAVTIGAFVDAALNQGATGDSGSLQGMLSRSGSSNNEKTFLTSFLAQRTKIVDTNDYNQPPNGKNRVKQWSNLLNDGETDLKNADAEIRKVTNWVMK